MVRGSSSDQSRVTSVITKHDIQTAITDTVPKQISGFQHSQLLHLMIPQVVLSESVRNAITLIPVMKIASSKKIPDHSMG